MAKQNNRKCIICGKSYSYCPQCGRDAGKPTWYFIFDGQNCHDIYEVCTQYRDNEINAEKAYELVSKLDLSMMGDFPESTRLQIEEIIRLHEESAVEVATVVEEEKVETEQYSYKNANNTKYYKKR